MLLQCSHSVVTCRILTSLINQIKQGHKELYNRRCNSWQVGLGIGWTQVRPKLLVGKLDRTRPKWNQNHSNTLLSSPYFTTISLQPSRLQKGLWSFPVMQTTSRQRISECVQLHQWISRLPEPDPVICGVSKSKPGPTHAKKSEPIFIYCWVGPCWFCFGLSSVV